MIVLLQNFPADIFQILILPIVVKKESAMILSLFAAMLRSVGVPTKLIKGESSNVEGYHAWNEVYINGKWRIVDTSYDSQLKAGGYSISKYKSSKDILSLNNINYF